LGRVLVLDLDDTLLRTDKSVSPGTLAALRAWQEVGNEFVVATGRPPRSVEGVLPDLLHASPRIAYNGAFLIEDGAVTYRNLIDPAAVRAVIDWTSRAMPHWHVGLEIEDRLYVNRWIEKPGRFEVADLYSLCDRHAAKIIFMFPGERDDIGPLLSVLPPTTRALITPKFNMVQLCGHTTDKADALRVLMGRQGRTLADAVAIGDDVNDVGMVRDAGYGIAVENAVPEVKHVADWITSSNNEEGVAAAITRLLEGVKEQG